MVESGVAELASRLEAMSVDVVAELYVVVAQTRVNKGVVSITSLRNCTDSWLGADGSVSFQAQRQPLLLTPVPGFL